MEVSFLGALVTFQVTFTELFIATTVIASIALTRGWRGAALGTFLGAAAIVVVAVITHGLLQRVPIYVLDWVSSLLLLGIGAFLLYEFWSAHCKGEGTSKIGKGDGLGQQISWAGVSVAAWAFFAEGLEILVVWLAISLREGILTATAGVLIGAVVLTLLAVILGKAGVFQRIAPKHLDLIAGGMVTLYGVYFLYAALEATLL